MKQIKKTKLAAIFGFKRSIIYYQPTKPANDEKLKDKVVAVMDNNPAYAIKELPLNWTGIKRRPDG